MTLIAQCPTCDQEIAPDGALNIGAAIESFRGWWSWKEPSSVSHTVPDHNGDYLSVTFVDKMTLAHEDMGNDRQEVWLLFDVDGKFYKQYGYGDSYGEINWDGPFKEVYKTERAVTVYE